jgi:hypothetical protein
MSEELQHLQEIGAQKIYEDTHIPVNQVQAILYEKYDGMTKVQFVGFISILEREYGVDLSATKAKGIAFFDEQKSTQEAEYAERIFVEPERRNKNIFIGLIAIIVALVVLAFYFFLKMPTQTLPEIEESDFNKSTTEELTTKVATPTFEKAEQNATTQAKAAVTEVNATVAQQDENNASQEELGSEEKALSQEQSEEPKAVADSLEIIPQSKVWLGYIDVKTNKKYQKTVRYRLAIDPTKEWLLLFGHGHVTVVVDGKKYRYSKRNTLRLHYKDGEITEISEREFRRLNRGRKW